jgi:hypothetical protein
MCRIVLDLLAVESLQYCWIRRHAVPVASDVPNCLLEPVTLSSRIFGVELRKLMNSYIFVQSSVPVRTVQSHVLKPLPFDEIGAFMRCNGLKSAILVSMSN